MKRFLGSLLIIFLSLQARADIGVILMDSLGFSRPIFQGGHSAVLISRGCIDKDAGGPKLRLCNENDKVKGVVLGRYMKLSHNEPLDFVPVPRNSFFYGVENPENAPYFANHKILKELRKATYERDLTTIISNPEDREYPRGRWVRNIGASFFRNAYVLMIQTSEDEDRQLIEKLNEIKHRGKFNMLLDNCSHMVRRTIKIIFPDVDAKVNGHDIFTTTPKGVEQASKEVLESEGRRVWIERVAQVPGTFFKSGPASEGRELLEETGVMFGAAALLGPAGILVGLGGMAVINHNDSQELYLERTLPMYKTLKDGIAVLSEREASLRVQVDGGYAGAEKLGDELNKVTTQRNEMLAQKRALLQDTFGSRSYWEQRRQQVDAMVSGLKDRLSSEEFNGAQTNGKSLLRYLEDTGEFSLDNEGRSVMTLKRSSGLSRVTLTPEGILLAQDRVAGFLAALARVQYELGATAQLSSRHHPLRTEFEKDFENLNQAFLLVNEK